MNKIYLEPISKAQTLVEGVKKQSEILAKKGICVDIERLNALCGELENAGRLQDEAEENLRMAREKAHAALNTLKDLYTNSKMSIKSSFPQETWLSFGVVDKK